MARRAVDLDQRSLTGRATLALVLTSMGDAETALLYIDRAVDLSSRTPLMLGTAAWAESVRGNAGRADAYYRELLARADLDAPDYSALATAATVTGHLDEAVRFAVLCVESNEVLSGTILYARNFVALRSHPRFSEVRAAFHKIGQG